MLCKTLSAAEFSPELHVAGSAARLRCYCRSPLNNSPLPSILIFPGGGYVSRGEVEAEPVALSFLSQGFQTFVLEYSLAPKKHPWQLMEAAAAISFIRKHSEDFFTLPDKIAVCGFSAGGHLAGALSNLWHEDFLSDALGNPRENFRPDAAILCYPFVSGKIEEWPLENIGVTYESNPELSLENSVSGKTPPCFIWHTADDPLVSVTHSLLLAGALQKHEVPFELHIYGHGPHVMSTATSFSAISPEHIDPHVATWTGLCSQWLNSTLLS